MAQMSGNIDMSEARLDAAAKKGRSRKKLLSIELVAFLFIAVYISGYTFSMINKPKIATEAVAYGQIDAPRQFDGIVVRAETVTFAEEAGTVIFSYAENEYIKKGSVICSVRLGDGDADIIESQINYINDDILSKSAVSDGEETGGSPVEIEEVRRINNKMKLEANASVPLFMTGDINEAYRLKRQLEKDIDTRNDILISGGDKKIAELVERKEAYERQLTEDSRSYAAGQGGILSYSTDGLETVFSPKNLLEITQEQTEGNFSKASSVERYTQEGGRLFKIVSSNEWYLCAYLDPELVVDWKEGTGRFIYFNEGGAYEKILMKIDKIEQRDDKRFVIFSSSKFLMDFINRRSVKFSLEDNTFKGLKIPNTAITQKTALSVPSEFIYEFRGSQGVYIADADHFVFRSVRALSQSDGKTRILQSFANIKLNDTIYAFEDGKVNPSKSHTISELLTTEGVYVANSGAAEFRQINILNNNDYYSIIENSQSTGGVKYFDSIVTDAKTVNDNQIIR